MARRVYADDVDTVSETRVEESTPVAATVANILTVVYGAVMALIGLDVLLEALDANEGNGFVSAIDTLSSPFLAPFEGMFDNQNYWATALVAAVVYTLAYLLAMAALRRSRTTVY
jgi:fluoride ion exporter CrcB/FEX